MQLDRQTYLNGNISELCHVSKSPPEHTGLQHNEGFSSPLEVPCTSCSPQLDSLADGKRLRTLAKLCGAVHQ